MHPACWLLCAATVVAAAAAPAAPTVPPDFWPPAPPSPRVAPKKGAPRPHVILHVTDDQGWANVGYHNEGHVITPTMDRLAAEGVRFERHYAYQWCAPSRASLLTGRLPYHVSEGPLGNGRVPTAVTRGMTMLPKKLQSVGYTTYQIGKWHLGLAMDWEIPAERGFNTSFGFLGGGENHITQAGLQGEWGCKGTDLWESHQPAVGKSGRYSGYLYNDAAVQAIEQHPDPHTNPLFIYLALQTMHAPLQVPSYFSDMYPDYTHTYAVSNGMATVSDSVLANVTAALEKRGMWERTLIIYLSDNGGPVASCCGASHANNYPLRGGKHSNWEGGIRVVAFASGGFVPAAGRGAVLTGITHNADWYPTIAALAGATPGDPPAPGVTDVPGVDGHDLWPYLTGGAAASPRTDVLISAFPSGGIVAGDLKLIFGVQQFAFWQSPVYPNATGPARGTSFDCGSGCLFNVSGDPAEHDDLAAARPADVARLTALYHTLNATEYASRAPQLAQNAAACGARAAELGGFLGPYYQFAP